ncbi:MAG: phosphate acyltransferase PlsX [Verrucomicrobiota bacterium]
MSQLTRKIALDAMGADRGTSEVVAGLKIALEHYDTLSGIVLVGNEEEIAPHLRAAGLEDDPRVSTFHASQVIGMHEKPIQSLKEKKDASLVRTVELVKLGQCVAAVSCGNTGSLMACATLRLRPLPGVGKPALATVWPSRNHHFVLLDGGANPQCKPENLAHNAVLGSDYARHALGIENPRVGLLSIGTEEGKGNDLVNDTHPLLQKLDGLIDYHGLIEGFDLFMNKVDVVVTDGFTGNVVLKTCESLWKTMRLMIREEFTRTTSRKLGAALLRGANNDLKARLDPDRFGGAPLLGLRGNVLKAHGSSSREAIAHAIRIAGTVVANDLNEHILADIEETNRRIRPSLASPA